MENFLVSHIHLCANLLRGVLNYTLRRFQKISSRVLITPSCNLDCQGNTESVLDVIRQRECSQSNCSLQQQAWLIQVQGGYYWGITQLTEFRSSKRPVL